MPSDRLTAEHQAVGFNLTGHPLDDYAPAMKRKQLMTLADLQRRFDRDGAAVGVWECWCLGCRNANRRAARGSSAWISRTRPGRSAAWRCSPRILKASARSLTAPTWSSCRSTRERGERGPVRPRSPQRAGAEDVVATAGPAAFASTSTTAAAALSVRKLLDRMTGAINKAPHGPVRFCVADPATGWRSRSKRARPSPCRRRSGVRSGRWAACVWFEEI